MEILRPLWVVPLNWLGDRLRGMIGVGPRWIMHLRLARRLVDQQSWGMIPLTSGMQCPIFDALRYLAKVGDVDSIPRLEALLETYSKPQASLYEHKWQGMRVVHSYGPQDYVPKDLQRATIKTLLELYPSFPEGHDFMLRMFEYQNLRGLAEGSIRELLCRAVSLRTHLELSPKSRQLVEHVLDPIFREWEKDAKVPQVSYVRSGGLDMLS